MSLYDFAERELDILGLNDGDAMNKSMREHILKMVQEFAKEGHSGFSASYAIAILQKVLAYEPLTPLTGEESEWTEVAKELTGSNQGTLWQNNRCSHVFKDDNGAYDINGKVFWEWVVDEASGEKFKSHFTNFNSRVPVTFPYTPTTVYEERKG